MSTTYILVSAGEFYLGIEMRYVQEIIYSPELQAVIAQYSEVVADYRGEDLPLLPLHRLVGLPLEQFHYTAALILEKYALAISSLPETTEVEDEDFRRMPHRWNRPEFPRAFKYKEQMVYELAPQEISR